jgi:outer membrane protein
MKRFPLLLAPFLILLMAPVHGAETGSIGFVDMQVVLDKSAMGQQAQQALKEKFAARQERFSEEERSIRQLQQTLARDEALMSQAQLDKKTAEIQGRIQEFEKMVREAKQDLMQEQNKLGNKILEPAQAIIVALAKEKQLSAVFERRQSGLMYIDDGLDLTAEVIKRLNAKK